jgi:DNA-binding beta-propeller fold protein YncE
MRMWITGALMVLLAGWAGAAAAAGPGYHVIETVPGPDGGWDYVRVDPALDRVFVTRGGSVMALELKADKVVAGLAPGAREHIALPIEGGAEILVTDGGHDSVLFADARTGAVQASVPAGKGPDAATYDHRSGLVLVIDHSGGAVTLIDPKARRAVGEIPVGGVLEEASVDGAGRGFVNIENEAKVAVVDIAARKVTARWALPACEGPTGSAYDARDKLLIVACQGATDVLRVADGSLVATLKTGDGADGVVYDAKRRLAFVPAARDGTLSVIAFDGAGPRIVQTLATEKGARTLAVDERTGRLYLPSAQYVAAPGGRFSTVPGTFHVLVVGP